MYIDLKYLILKVGYVIEFSGDKNRLLLETRKVSFWNVIDEILEDGVVDEYPHPNQDKYPKQRYLIIFINNYCYGVPYVLDKKNKTIFFKTLYPSRNLKRKYKRHVKNQK